MDATGGHHVKRIKPGSERPRPHVFSHMWKIDPKEKHIHKTNIIMYKLICRTWLQYWNYSMELGRGGKGKENDSQQY
jgi:16S rRNA A1518/A1519 N6-dimethyltransferase RsmA/KsgA/DIM1 with predicted DNA glycosylase/AP lyase activity